MRVALWVLIAACVPPAGRPGGAAKGFEAGEAALAAARTPADVARLCESSKRTLGSLRDAALAPGAAMLPAVQKLDRAASIAIGTVDVLANLHPDAPMRDAARTCETALTAMVADVQMGPLVGKLANVQDEYARRIVAGARLSGAGLSPEAGKRLEALVAREAKLTGEMTEAMGTSPTPVVVDAARLAGLPAELMAGHPADAQGKVSLDPTTDWRPIATYATDRALATELMRAYLARVDSNVARLRELLEVRRDEAQVLGCGSYVECQARTRMVQTHTRTEKFLADLTGMIEQLDPQYRAALGLAGDVRVPEADLRFVERRARAKAGLPDPEAWLAYLETGPTLDRLLEAIGTGTGLRFVPTSAPTWSPDVRVFDVERAGKRIGRFYFDLYLRPGKVPFSGQTMPFVPHTPGSRDEPVSAVIAIGVPPGHPSLLRPAGYLKLLMHETGHAIDFLFETQSMLEPVEADFMDVPSQLFEQWAQDPAFLQAIGRKGNEPLPREGADAITTDLRWDQWKFLREVTALGLIDLSYHGDQVPADLTAAYAAAYERVFPMTVDRASHPEAELFIPTIVYAGNGHGLPWGLAIAMDIAGEFPRGMQDPATWSRLFDQVLSVDAPAEGRIEGFLGRPWNLDRLRAHALPPFGH